jgi:hypothetical protein
MIPTRACIIMIFLFHCTFVSATKYYVSSSGGNDSGSGKSEDSAWKTISKVNGKTFSPGDSILFRRGDVWRETLVIPSSGTPTAYIVFSWYGTGANPAFLGSMRATAWTATTGNIWQSATSLTDPYTSSTGDIFFLGSDTIFGIPKAYSANFSGLTSEYNWTWNANTIYVYSATNPDTRYKSIEASQREFSVNLNFKEYIEINGIDMFFEQWGGITEKDNTLNLSGVIVRNCELAFNGTPNGYGYGTYFCYNKTLIEYNVIHDCGRRGVSYVNYGSSDISGAIIQNNIFYNGNHTTSLDVETGSNSASGNLDKIIFRNNLVYDDPAGKAFSQTLFAQGPHGGTGQISGLYIYNNIFKFPSGMGVSLEDVDGSFIYNNTFYGNNTNHSPTYHVFYDDGCTSAKIKNNIFYTLLATDASGSGAGIVSVNTDTKQIDADYNLYYRINNSVRIVYVNGFSYFMNGISNIRSSLGWEKNSPIPADPKFVSSSDFRLQSGSPAIGKGINVTVSDGSTTITLEKDYNGRFYNNPPSIGASEGNPTDVAPPPPVPPSQPGKTVYIFPNPSDGLITIYREGTALEAENFRIINLSGKVMFNDILKKGVNNEQFPVNLVSGIYFIQMLSGKMISAQKLIIVR